MRFGAVITSHGEDELFPPAVERLRAEADKVIAIENIQGHNEGVADIVNPRPLSNSQNINQGYRRLVSCELVIICNSDIIIPEGWRAPIEAAFRDPRVGAATLPIKGTTRAPGLYPNTPMIFTAIRRSAVTWAGPVDVRMVNGCDDLMLSWMFYSRNWKQVVVDGPMLIHVGRRTTARLAGLDIHITDSSLPPQEESFLAGQVAPRSGYYEFCACFEDEREGAMAYALMVTTDRKLPE